MIIDFEKSIIGKDFEKLITPQPEMSAAEAVITNLIV